MAGFIGEAKLDYKDGKKGSCINKPDKFSHNKWVAWEETVYNYFTGMINIQVVPLLYVIRNTPAPSGIFVYMEQDIIQNAPLEGNFSRDTKKVIAILKESTLYTDTEIWLKGG